MVLVANHPIGSLDGSVLRAVAAVRPDVKVVASQLLTYIEPLRNLFVPVDNVAYKTSRKQIEGMQQQLDNQGALILFPAGEVSRMSPKGIRDGHWHTGFLRGRQGARADRADPHQRAQQQPVLLYFADLPAAVDAAAGARNVPAAGGRIKIRIGGRVPFANWHDGHTSARIWRSVFAAMCIARQSKPGLFASESPIALPEERLELKKALANCERLG